MGGFRGGRGAGYGGILAVILVAGGLWSPAGAPAAEEVLTNESVVGMVWGQLPESVIIAKIRSTRGQYDLRVETLLGLKKMGVPDKVLEAMLQPQAPPPPGQGGPGLPAMAWGAPAPAGPAAGVAAPPALPAPGVPATLPLPGSQPEGAAPGMSGAGGNELAGIAAAIQGIVEAVRAIKGDEGAAVAAAPEGTAPAPPALPVVGPPPTAPPAEAGGGLAPVPPGGQSEAPGQGAVSSPAGGSRAGGAGGRAGESPPEARRGQLGVRILTITPELAQKLGSPGLRGVGVGEVLPGSPAAEAGVQPGDIITHVQGRPVRSTEELVASLEHRQRGEATPLRLLREGTPLELTVPVASGAAAPRPRPAQPPSPPPPGSREIRAVAGVYRCWMFNVGGAGGRCRTAPPLVLHADGTYQESSARGTFTVRGDRIVFSESKVRGPGRLEGGNRIVFEYTYNNQPHVVTYLRQDASEAPPAPEPRPSAGPPAPAGRAAAVPVELTLRFAPSDGSAGWVNSVALVPHGSAQGQETLAVTDGKQVVKAWFRPPLNAVATGRLYTVYTGTGTDRRRVGTIDLRDASGPAAFTLEVPPPPRDRDRFAAPRAGGASGAPASGGPASPPPSGEGGGAGKPCNPNLPLYAQKGCKG